MAFNFKKNKGRPITQTTNWKPGETRRTKSGIDVKYDPGAEPHLEVDGQKVSMSDFELIPDTAPPGGEVHAGLGPYVRMEGARLADADILDYGDRQSDDINDPSNLWHGASEPAEFHFATSDLMGVPPNQWAAMELDWLRDGCHNFTREMAGPSTWKKANRQATESILECLSEVLDETALVLWEPEIWNFSQAGAREAFANTEILPSDEPPCVQYFVTTKIAMPDVETIEFYELFYNTTPYTLSGWGMLPFRSLHSVAKRFDVRFASPAEFGFVPFLVFSPLTEVKIAPKSRAETLSQHLPLVRLLPACCAGNKMQGGHVPIIAAWRFMHTEIIDPEGAEPLPRPQRREYARQGKTPPAIRRILLRKRHTGEHRGPAGEHSGYTCRWAVRPHWRKNHRPQGAAIHVSGYVKGPDNAPFKLGRTFTHVTR